MAALSSPNTRNSSRVDTAIPSTVSELERDALYEDFQPLVRRLMSQYGSDPGVRDDLRGEIYFRFCELVAAYDPSRGIPIKPYLVRTLTASVYSYARSRWRLRQRESSLDAEIDWEARPGSPNPSDEWDDQLMMRNVLRELPAVIARLPLRQRQVVIWRYYESRSYDDIAETLGIQPATARSLLRYGIRALRREIGALGLLA
jgi:RNA polymerase sigma factor (sigma-70 family)